MRAMKLLTLAIVCWLVTPTGLARAQSNDAVMSVSSSFHAYVEVKKVPTGCEKLFTATKPHRSERFSLVSEAYALNLLALQCRITGYTFKLEGNSFSLDERAHAGDGRVRLFSQPRLRDLLGQFGVLKNECKWKAPGAKGSCYAVMDNDGTIRLSTDLLSTGRVELEFKNRNTTRTLELEVTDCRLRGGPLVPGARDMSLPISYDQRNCSTRLYPDGTELGEMTLIEPSGLQIPPVAITLEVKKPQGSPGSNDSEDEDLLAILGIAEKRSAVDPALVLHIPGIVPQALAAYAETGKKTVWKVTGHKWFSGVVEMHTAPAPTVSDISVRYGDESLNARWSGNDAAGRKVAVVSPSKENSIYNEVRLNLALPFDTKATLVSTVGMGLCGTNSQKGMCREISAGERIEPSRISYVVEEATHHPLVAMLRLEEASGQSRNPVADSAIAAPGTAAIAEAPGEPSRNPVREASPQETSAVQRQRSWAATFELSLAERAQRESLPFTLRDHLVVVCRKQSRGDCKSEEKGGGPYCQAGDNGWMAVDNPLMEKGQCFLTLKNPEPTWKYYGPQEVQVTVRARKQAAQWVRSWSFDPGDCVSKKSSTGGDVLCLKDDDTELDDDVRLSLAFDDVSLVPEQPVQILAEILLADRRVTYLPGAVKSLPAEIETGRSAFTFQANIRPQGLWRGPWGIPMRFFCTLPVDVISVRTPATASEIVDSQDNPDIQLVGPRTGLMCGVEPWDAVDNSNRWAAFPTRFLFGLQAVELSQLDFRPSVLVGFQVKVPILDEVKNDTAWFGVYAEKDVSEPYNRGWHLLFTTSLDFLGILGK